MRVFAAASTSLLVVLFSSSAYAQDVDTLRSERSVAISVASSDASQGQSDQIGGAGTAVSAVSSTSIMTPVGGYDGVNMASMESEMKPRKEGDVVKKEKKKRNLGRLSGSFETNTIYYVDDPATSSIAPNPPVGSHNFLKLDYTNGKFAAGIQAEYYPYVLQGYQNEFQGFGIPEKYISYTDDSWSILVGDFYEQFGSGMLFRSWEDRQLGINNSIGGARVAFNIKDIFSFKAIYGFPRDYLHSIGRGYDFAGSLFNDYGPTQIYGGDAYLSLSNWFFPESDHGLFVAGSVINRFERYPPTGGDYDHLNIPQNVLGYSARLGYSYSGFSISGEYVGRGKDLYFSPQTSKFELKTGNAQLVEVNYAGHGLSVSGSFRRLSNMQSVAYHEAGALALPGNTMNYIPALTLQQSYMLATHNPYNPKLEGEIGGMIDLFYTFKRGSAVGGKYGMKLHANASMYYATAEALHGATGNRLAYRDFTFDVEKTWSRKFKTIFFVSIQENSPSYGEYKKTEAQNIFVVDMQYKFTPKLSLRAELQYLYSEERTRDWVAALLEVNFAPKWSVYVSDMYNHGSSNVHYYSVGASFTSGIWRVAANWGRNREGYVCSGGVCRWQPAYTGANLQLSIIF